MLPEENQISYKMEKPEPEPENFTWAPWDHGGDEIHQLFNALDLIHGSSPTDWDYADCARQECRLGKKYKVNPAQPVEERVHLVHLTVWEHVRNYPRTAEVDMPVQLLYRMIKDFLSEALDLDTEKDRVIENNESRFHFMQEFINHHHKNIFTCPCNKEDGRDIYTRLSVVILSHATRLKAGVMDIAPSYYRQYKKKFPQLSWTKLNMRLSAHAFLPGETAMTDSSKQPRGIRVVVGHIEQVDDS